MRPKLPTNQFLRPAVHEFLLLIESLEYHHTSQVPSATILQHFRHAITGLQSCLDADVIEPPLTECGAFFDKLEQERTKALDRLRDAAGFMRATLHTANLVCREMEAKLPARR